MIVKFWGVRGSIPSPLSTEEFRTKISSILWQSRTLLRDLDKSANAPGKEDFIKIETFVAGLPAELNTLIGGNTPCIQLTPSDGETFIIDCGSGLRLLGKELMKGEFGKGKGHASILISHTHWDHIQGIPFFQPIFIKGNEFDFYGLHSDLEERLAFQQNTSYFPVEWNNLDARINIKIFDASKAIEIGSTKIRAHELSHPGASYSFRIEDADGSVIVYASDAEYKHLDKVKIKDYLEFFNEADILIFDAHFTLGDLFNKEDWGHSSAFIGLEMAVEAGVKNMVMFHHEPSYSDDELIKLLRKANEYNDIIKKHQRHECNIFLAREGMILNTEHLN